MIIKCALGGLAIMLLIAFGAYHYNMVVNYNDASGVRVHKYFKDGVSYINVNALVGHSAYAISKVKKIREKDGILIVPYMSFAKKGMTGTLDVDIEITLNVKNIYFGGDRVLIWSDKDE